jgi:hypothetical protein
MPILRFLASVCLALTLLALNACTHVKPYQREYLTRPGMDVKGELLVSEFEAHVQSAREGAVGGHGTTESTGGGCGCN